MAGDEENAADRTMIMTPTALSGEREPAPRSRLVCRNPTVLGSPAGQEVLLDGDAVTIGRGAEHDVSLKADGISRNHAKLFPGVGAWGIEDMGSTNGVLVNGAKARQAWLKSGDVIILGTVEYTFEHLPEAPATGETDAMREAEKTVVMRPTVKAQAQATASTSASSKAEYVPSTRPAAAPAPGAATRTQTSQRPAGTRNTSREQPKKSGSGMTLIIVLAVAVAAAIGFVLLR